jgi:serine/threonine protein kinase
MSVRDTLKVGIQLISIIQSIHGLGLLHNDIEPANISIVGKQVYLIDYSSVERYRSLRGAHRPNLSWDWCQGNELFCSVARLQCQTPSRRDDMVSIAYVLAYTHNGYRPLFSSQSQLGIPMVTLARHCKLTLSNEEFCHANDTPWLSDYLSEAS